MNFRNPVLVAATSLFIGSIAQADVSSNSRLLQKPEWDGAIVTNNWFSAEGRYQQNESDGDDIDFLIAGATFITSLPEISNDLELGTRWRLINVSYDDYKSEFGFSDIELWGKYRFHNQDKLQLSGGMALSLPIGSDGIFHHTASGELNLEFFGAARYQSSETSALIGHVGLRRNGDMEVELDGKGNNADLKGELDGETQIELGVGIIHQLKANLNLMAEFNFASEAYDDTDNDIELTGGFELQAKPNMMFKGGVGLGMDDGAPDVELLGSCVFTF